jgi:hypothetical protein
MEAGLIWLLCSRVGWGLFRRIDGLAMLHGWPARGSRARIQSGKVGLANGTTFPNRVSFQFG